MYAVCRRKKQQLLIQMLPHEAHFRFPEKKKKTLQHVCWIKIACALLFSSMCSILYQMFSFVCEHERLVSLLISRADSCCLIAGVWTDRWPLWEREEGVLRVEEDLSTSLPLAASAVSHETHSLHYKHFSVSDTGTFAVRFVPSTPTECT